MSGTALSRPPGLVASVVATLALALFSLVLAVLSLSVGHGFFSGGVAVALLVWALMVGAGGALLWRGVGLARGPVVAAGLLHVLAFAQFALTEPWTILGALAGLVATVGAILPSTRAALSRER
ncbi:MAG: hypothetical protein ACLGHZ_10405 [Actinomycetes bacterium]